jgi:hypothetical protein
MFFEWSRIDPMADSVSAVRTDVMHKTLRWLMGRDGPTATVLSPNGGEVITNRIVLIAWTEANDGANVVSRTIEYSVDDGASWSLITKAAGPSPYTWNLGKRTLIVPNTATARVRVRIHDDGDPSLSHTDVSDAAFSIQRTDGDRAGPVVVAGSIRVNPDPIRNQEPASLEAVVTDSLAGGAIIAAAEWSTGLHAASPGSGNPMSGNFDSPRVQVIAALPTATFPPGQRTLWVRGKDGAGNWGPARELSLVVNGQPVSSAGDPTVLNFELRQNVPNPVDRTTVIAFAVPYESPIEVSIYDVSGRRVRGLVRRNMDAGLHRIEWNRADDGGRAVLPGIYYCRFVAGGRSFERKMVVL